MLRRLILQSVSAREDEVAPLLWATAYGFCILLSYYVLRAVRDEISAADRGNLQYLWTAVFLAMLVVVPLYSWAASRWPRGVFVPLVSRFFIVNLLLFYAALALLPASARPPARIRTISQRVAAPETSRISVKLAGSISVVLSAWRQRIEFAAKAIMVSTTRISRRPA